MKAYCLILSLLVFPSPCGEIKGQNFGEVFAHGFPQCMFPSPCGEIKGQNKMIENLKKKLERFPSPCGEIKGQNDWEPRVKVMVNSMLFPSPCGEIKGQNCERKPSQNFA